MDKKEIEGGATEFLLNFDALLKANEAEELKSVSLRSVRASLETEINELKKKANAIETQIKESLFKCDKEIVNRKDSAEINFEKERNRLAELSRKLELQKEEQLKHEEYLRHQDSLLNERDRKLLNFDSELRHKEVNLSLEKENNDSQKQANSSELMRLKILLQSIEEREVGIKEGLKGLEENLMHFRKQQSEVRELEEKLKVKIKEIDELGIKNVTDRNEIENIKVQLMKDQNQINASLNILNKQKKDNEDKEAALKAMKIDLDFKIAQLKREHEKGNK